MTKSQLYAISYSYSRKQKDLTEEKAKAKNIDLIFEYQSVYKSLKGFVESKDNKKLEKAYKQALQNIINRKKQLELSNCHSEKYTDCLTALSQVENALNNINTI